MTRFQALYVKYCRIKLECSWRVVQAMWVNRYCLKIPFDINFQWDTNQIKGRELCNKSQILLNENWEDG